MADAISIQELIDARTDAKTLEEAVNGDAVTTVLSRLGESYPTLANALSQIDGKLDSADAQIKQGITNLFENGGLPATPFATKALMTASALVDGDYAMVTDDTVNNGLYVKTAGVWVKSSYDPLTQAKADATNKANNAKTESIADSKTYADSAIKNATKNSVSTFNNFELLTLSSLPDDSYALVANDEDSTKNSHYRKVSGSWVKIKYDTNRPKNEAAANYPLESIKVSDWTVGYLKSDGSTVTNGNFNTSGFIAVEKGDCLLLRNMKLYNLTTSFFSFYNEAQVFQGQSTNALLKDALYTDKQMNTAVGADIFYKPSNVFTVAFIAPQKGFVKVSYAVNGTMHPYYNEASPVSLLKTDFEGILSEGVIHTSKEILKSYKGIMSSVITDPLLTDASNTTAKAPNSAGVPVTFSGNSQAVSIKYPVVAGDYIHFHGAASVLNATMYFEDASGNYLGEQSLISELSMTTTGSGGSQLNMISRFTGFMRIQVNSTLPSLNMVAITKERIDHEIKYLKAGQRLEFMPALGRGATLPPSANYLNFNLTDFMSRENFSASYWTTSFPYRLKKGEVLEYSLDAASSPCLALVYKADMVVTGVSTAGNKNYSSYNMPLLAPEVLHPKDLVDWDNAGRVAAKPFLNQARAGKVAYCNEDYDTVVIFLRPTKVFTDYQELSQKQSYNLNVLSINEYKRKRDAELKNRFNLVGAFNGSVVSEKERLNVGIYASGSSNPMPLKGGSGTAAVLLFKGEVLNYMTTAKTPNTFCLHLDKVGGSATAPEITWDMSKMIAGVSPSSASFVYQYDFDVTLENPLSYSINQVYAFETCIVIPTINLFKSTGLISKDINGLIANNYIEPRIININDARIGENLVPFTGLDSNFIGLAYGNPEDDIYSYRIATSGSQLSMASFAAANIPVETSWWSESTTHNTWVNYIKPTTGLAYDKTSFNAVYFRDKKDVFARGEYTQPCLNKCAFVPSKPALIIVNSNTKPRSITEIYDNGNMVEALDLVNPLQIKAMEVIECSMSNISNHEFKEDYAVTDKTRFNIPITNNIIFDFKTATSISLDNALWSVLQIKAGDEVLITLHAKTNNQGQSTAALTRKNVNVEFYNDKYEDVFIKFGDNIAESEIVLKSYLLSDRSHWKESTSTDLWYRMRTSAPYPEGGVLPNSVFEDLSTPTNQLAKGAPFIFPVELHHGGKFFSLASVRNKKKRTNYAMQKNNLNNILIQATGVAMLFDWSTVQLANFEVREPSIPDYEEGDASLPAEFVTVETEITRLLDWMRGVNNGTIDIKTTYQDYIDLESFLDYGIALQTTYHWDGVVNNFLLGTHNAEEGIWRVYWYDSDQSMGATTTGGSRSPYSILDARFFQKVLTEFSAETNKRYKFLRESGALTIESVQAKINNTYKMVNSYSRAKDREYWGVGYYSESLPFGLDWIYKRVNYLDAYFQYVNRFSDKVGQVIYSLSGLAPNATRVVTITGTKVVTSDVLRVVTGYGNNITATATCTVNGTIQVTLTNNSAVIYNEGSSFIHVYKD